MSEKGHGGDKKSPNIGLIIVITIVAFVVITENLIGKFFQQIGYGLREIFGSFGFGMQTFTVNKEFALGVLLAVLLFYFFKSNKSGGSDKKDDHPPTKGGDGH